MWKVLELHIMSDVKYETSMKKRVEWKVMMSRDLNNYI